MSDENDLRPNVHIARLIRERDEARAKLAALQPVIVDLCWKATQYGRTKDGDTLAYILPKGAVHRLIGVAQGVGFPAAFRLSPEREEQLRRIAE